MCVMDIVNGLYSNLTEGQQRLLEDGWIGTAMEQQNGEWVVHYQK